MARKLLKNNSLLVGREALAKLCGKSEGTVRLWVRKGIIERANPDAGAGEAALFDLASELPKIVAYAEQSRELGPEDAAYRRARREAMQSKSEMLKLELAELRGQLHRSEDISLCWAFMVAAARNKFLGVPNKCARLVAAESDPLTIQRILTSAVHEALVELRADLAGAIRARSKKRLAGNGAGRHA